MSKTVTVYLLDEPEIKYMPREYMASIKKEAKTYWLINVEGFHAPWKFSKADNLRVKPEHDTKNYKLFISETRHLGTIDTLIKEAKQYHAESQIRHEYFIGKLTGLMAGIFACFGSQHEQYIRVRDCNEQLQKEWRELLKNNKD